MGNGRVLVITSLTEALLGSYSCNATNERGSDVSVLPVIGPPPPPAGIPDVSRKGSQFTISWLRPTSSDAVITGYKVNLYL